MKHCGRCKGAQAQWRASEQVQALTALSATAVTPEICWNVCTCTREFNSEALQFWFRTPRMVWMSALLQSFMAAVQLG